MIFPTKSILAMRVARALSKQPARTGDLADVVHDADVLLRILRKLIAQRLK
jgi:hypothetical protein